MRSQNTRVSYQAANAAKKRLLNKIKNDIYIVRYNKNGEKITQKTFATKTAALSFAKIKISKGYKVSFGKKG